MLTVEQVRNMISNFHTLSIWKVIFRELTRNAPLFCRLIMQCYVVIAYEVVYSGSTCTLVHLHVLRQKLGFSKC